MTRYIGTRPHLPQSARSPGQVDVVPKPEWWNGRHCGLKHRPRSVGSSPTRGTQSRKMSVPAATMCSCTTQATRTGQGSYLAAAELSRDAQSAMGISRALRDWRGATPKRDLYRARRTCPRCAEVKTLVEPQRDYAYLLGLYFGDGCTLARGRARTSGPFASCAADAWPGLVVECRQAMMAVRPGNSVCLIQKEGCAPSSPAPQSTGRVCFRSTGLGGNTSGKSSLSRGRKRSLAGTPGISLVASFTRTAAGLSTGSGARLRAAIASTSSRGICSSTCPPTYTGCAGRRSTGSGSLGGSPSRRRSRWPGGRRSPGWTSSSAPSTDEPGTQAGPARASRLNAPSERAWRHGLR